MLDIFENADSTKKYWEKREAEAQTAEMLASPGTLKQEFLYRFPHCPDPNGVVRDLGQIFPSFTKHPLFDDLAQEPSRHGEPKRPTNE